MSKALQSTPCAVLSNREVKTLIAHINDYTPLLNEAVTSLEEDVKAIHNELLHCSGTSKYLRHFRNQLGAIDGGVEWANEQGEIAIKMLTECLVKAKSPNISKDNKFYSQLQTAVSKAEFILNKQANAMQIARKEIDSSLSKVKVTIELKEREEKARADGKAIIAQSKELQHKKELKQKQKLEEEFQADIKRAAQEIFKTNIEMYVRELKVDKKDMVVKVQDIKEVLDVNSPIKSFSSKRVFLNVKPKAEGGAHEQAQKIVVPAKEEVKAQQKIKEAAYEKKEQDLLLALNTQKEARRLEKPEQKVDKVMPKPAEASEAKHCKSPPAIIRKSPVTKPPNTPKYHAEQKQSTPKKVIVVKSNSSVSLPKKEEVVPILATREEVKQTDPAPESKISTPIISALSADAAPFVSEIPLPIDYASGFEPGIFYTVVPEHYEWEMSLYAESYDSPE